VPARYAGACAKIKARARSERFQKIAGINHE